MGAVGDDYSTAARSRSSHQEITMSKYEVSSSKSAYSFGVYEADSAEAAIEAACRDAGYDSKADAEAAMGREAELTAVEAK
jgi:hypothetical protein